MKKPKFQVGQVVASKRTGLLERVVKVFAAGKGTYKVPSLIVSVSISSGNTNVEIFQSDVRFLTKREKGGK